MSAPSPIAAVEADVARQAALAMKADVAMEAGAATAVEMAIGRNSAITEVSLADPNQRSVPNADRASLALARHFA
jgi:hypothetical protein